MSPEEVTKAEGGGKLLSNFGLFCRCLRYRSRPALADSFHAKPLVVYKRERKGVNQIVSFVFSIPFLDRCS
jgi:hypothetical protein